MRILRAASLLVLLLPLLLLAQHSPVVTSQPAPATHPSVSTPPPAAPVHNEPPHASPSPRIEPTSHSAPSARTETGSNDKHTSAVPTPVHSQAGKHVERESTDTHSKASAAAHASVDRRNSNGDKASQNKVKRTKEIDKGKNREDKLREKEQKKVDRERQKERKKVDKEEDKKRKKIDKEQKKRAKLTAKEAAKKPPYCGGRVSGGKCICSNGSVADEFGRCAVVASAVPLVNACPVGQVMRGGICALQNRNSCGGAGCAVAKKGTGSFRTANQETRRLLQESDQRSLRAAYERSCDAGERNSGIETGGRRMPSPERFGALNSQRAIEMGR